MCSFLSMEISYALLAGTGNLGGAVCQFDCSKLGFYYEINPVYESGNEKTKWKQTLVSSGGCLNSRSDVCRDFLHTH